MISIRHMNTFVCLAVCAILFSPPLPFINYKLALLRVFLGYPSNHRGYKYLDLSSNRIFISRHVQFDETQFPFGKHHSPMLSEYQFLDSNYPVRLHPMVTNQSNLSHLHTSSQHPKQPVSHVVREKESGSQPGCEPVFSPHTEDQVPLSSFQPNSLSAPHSFVRHDSPSFIPTSNS